MADVSQGKVSLGLGKPDVSTPTRAEKAKAEGYICGVANVHQSEHHCGVWLRGKGRTHIRIVEYALLPSPVIVDGIASDIDTETMAQRIDEALADCMTEAGIT